MSLDGIKSFGSVTHTSNTCIIYVLFTIIYYIYFQFRKEGEDELPGVQHRGSYFVLFLYLCGSGVRVENNKVVGLRKEIFK